MRQATPTLGRIAIIVFVLFGSGWIASYFFNGKKHERGVSSQPSYGTPNSMRAPQSVNGNDMRNRILEKLRDLNPKDPEWQLSMNDRHEVKSISNGVLATGVTSEKPAQQLAKKLLDVFGASGDVSPIDLHGEITDQANLRKFSFQQIYVGEKSYPVLGATITLHAEDDGVVNTADTAIKPVDEVDESVKVDEQQAKALALKDPSSRPNSAELEDPQPWVYVAKTNNDDRKGVLVWKVVTTDSRHGHRVAHILVSATDGTILKPSPNAIYSN